MFSVPLNSFLHRVSDKSQVMANAVECGCQLKRVRRSRNWLLVAQEHQLIEFKTMLTHEKDGWIVIAIDKVLPKPVEIWGVTGRAASTNRGLRANYRN